MKVYSCLVIAMAIFTCSFSLVAGLIKGTLVATSQGLATIESLEVGSYVLSYDINSTSFLQAKVKAVSQYVSSCACCIETEKETIIASPDQLFFDKTTNRFISTSDLNRDSVLAISNGEDLVCVSVEIENQPCVLYEITLEEPHLFFSSKSMVLTHNMAAATQLVPWAIGTQNLLNAGAVIAYMGLNKIYQVVKDFALAKASVAEAANVFADNLIDLIDKKKFDPFSHHPSFNSRLASSLFQGLSLDYALYNHIASCPLAYGPLCWMAKMQPDGNVGCIICIARFERKIIHYGGKKDFIFQWHPLAEGIVDRTHSLVKEFVTQQDAKDIEEIRTLVLKWPLEVRNTLASLKTTIFQEPGIKGYPIGCFIRPYYDRGYGPQALYSMALHRIAPSIIGYIITHGEPIRSRYPNRLLFFDINYSIVVVQDEKTKHIIHIGTYPDDVAAFGGVLLKEELKPSKNVDDILKEATPGRKTQGKATQFEKPGGYPEALKDFESLGLKDIQNINGVLVGTLPDGRRVNVRTKSEDGRPTLEIFNPTNKRSIKIRYGNKQ